METKDTKDQGAYSVTAFCFEFGNFTRPHFYSLLKRGKGPRIFKIGKRTLISHAAALEWVARMEQETVQGGAA